MGLFIKTVLLFSLFFMVYCGVLWRLFWSAGVCLWLVIVHLIINNGRLGVSWPRFSRSALMTTSTWKAS